MSIKDFKVDSDIAVDDLIIDLSYSTSSGGLIFDNSTQSYKTIDSNIPVGVVRMWASGSTSPTVPEDYLICDGRQNLSQTEYARLYSVIGNRFTSSPNGSTFGLPSFNSSSKQYPAVIGINSSNDTANAGVFLQTANQNTTSIGSNASTSHSHTTGAGFSINSSNPTSLAHSHNSNDVASPGHNHSWTTGTTGGTSHNHNCNSASVSHDHGYTLGNGNYVESSNASGNHTHSTLPPGENHAHTTNSSGHTHASSGPEGLSSSNHSHAFATSLSASSITHSHQIETSGFYFIIRYR
jgi:hypothetical protein